MVKISPPTGGRAPGKRDRSGPKPPRENTNLKGMPTRTELDPPSHATSNFGRTGRGRSEVDRWGVTTGPTKGRV